MKKIALTALAAATALAAGAPAMAQTYGYRDYDRDARWDTPADYRADHRGGHWDRGDYNINRRQDQLARYIEDGVRRGSLSRWEARNLRGELNEIARLEARYRYNGLSRGERFDLDRRMDRLEMQIRHDRTDNDRRGREYGYYR